MEAVAALSQRVAASEAESEGLRRALNEERVAREEALKRQEEAFAAERAELTRVAQEATLQATMAEDDLEEARGRHVNPRDAAPSEGAPVPAPTDDTSSQIAARLASLEAQLRIAKLDALPKVARPSSWGAGKDDPPVREFLSHLENCFGDSSDEAGKVRLAESVLTKGPLAYWTGHKNLLLKSGSPVTYDSMRISLLDAYGGEDVTEVSRKKLKNLTQTGSVEAYNRSFTQLVANIPEMSEADRVFQYKEGLKASMRPFVLIDPTTGSKFTTLVRLMKVAVDVDTELKGSLPSEAGPSSSREKPNGKRPRSEHDSRRPPNGKKQSKWAKPATPKLVNGMTRDQLYKEGRCLLCGEKGHLAKDCTQKKHSSDGGSSSGTNNKGKGKAPVN